VEGSCEHGNEPSGCIKCWEFLECLRNWQLLKKGSAPRVSEKRPQKKYEDWTKFHLIRHRQHTKDSSNNS
jgi:hypothetical protein